MKDGRIVDWAEYGRHIPLHCKNHPELRWSTKNISNIGARHVFYTSHSKPECECPLSDLEPVRMTSAVQQP